MNIVVLKFGGSSVSNNENLNLVADKILDFKRKGKSVVAIVSAQGKTTDKLINEAKELSSNPNKREMDMLISVGEQVSASKLAIVLNNKNAKAVSLNAWQIQIKTDGNFQKARIVSIDKDRIIKELEDDKIVIVTGFQGIDINNNITTLGRGGSDTTAVAVAHILGAKRCFIYSDVDGVYSADPRKIEDAVKMKKMSFKEMQYASFEGAKVLHDRCVMLANKYDLPIVSASTFNNHKGSLISHEENIEEEKIKTIIKNDNIVIVKYKSEEPYSIVEKLNNKKITFGNLILKKKSIEFTIMKNDLKELDDIEKSIQNASIESKKMNKYKSKNVTKISIVGSGISNNKEAIKETINTFKEIKQNIILFEISAFKISILFNRIIDDKYLKTLHKKLIKN